MRMEQTLAELQPQRQYAGCIPFLYAYYLVTKQIIQAGQQKNFFEYPEALKKLDLCFAELYFDPLLKWKSSRQIDVSPWKTYYLYCQTPRPRAFVALLLGINAHINGDLPIALATTQYDKTTDFNTIDQVLADVVPELMRFLASHSVDVMAWGGVLFPKFTQQEFTHLVIRWRHQAWENSLQISPENLNSQRKLILQHTEDVAKQLIFLFRNPLQSLFHRHEWRELKVVL